MSENTHYRKVFDSPYLSSADVVEPVTFTIAKVTQEVDRTKKTRDVFNTAYFVEKEIRPGEKLKPMILNATNSKVIHRITGTPFIEEWGGTRVTIYVDNNVRFGRETVEGLRIREAPRRTELTPDATKAWANAKNAYRRDGNLEAVLKHMDVSQENITRLIAEVKAESTNGVA